MHKTLLNLFLNSCSDNLKAKIEKRPRRRKWVGCLAILVLLAGWVGMAEAQQPAKVAKLGEISGRAALTPRNELLPRALSGLDYVDGKDRILKTGSAEGKLDPLRALADELVHLNVDVLLASSAAEALIFKSITRTIPIVFIVASDPVADGLVESLARPGGNITGVTTLTTALAGKRLELLKETIPKLSRVAVLWDSQDPSSARLWKESQFAARELGLQLHSMAVSSVDKLEGAFKETIKARSAALAVMPSPMATYNPKLISNLATKYRLPAIFDLGEFVTSGGLMSYGADQAEPYRRAALIVDKILKGAKPADIPVEQPTKFELSINLKTAKALGLTIPPTVLKRAQTVIK